MATKPNLTRPKKTSITPDREKESSDVHDTVIEPEDILVQEYDSILIQEPDSDIDVAEESINNVSHPELKDFKTQGEKLNQDRILSMITTNPELVNMTIKFTSSKPVFELGEYNAFVTKKGIIELQ